jgi:hypothetical protein
MIYSIFRVVYSLLCPINPAKEIVDRYRAMEEGQKVMRKYRNELARLEQDRPKYPVSKIGLYQQHLTK